MTVLRAMQVANQPQAAEEQEQEEHLTPAVRSPAARNPGLAAALAEEETAAGAFDLTVTTRGGRTVLTVLVRPTTTVVELKAMILALQQRQAKAAPEPEPEPEPEPALTIAYVRKGLDEEDVHPIGYHEWDSARYGRMTPERTYETIRAVQERKRNDEKMGAMILMVDGRKKKRGLGRDTDTLEDCGVGRGAVLALLAQHAAPQRKKRTEAGPACCSKPASA